jgi:hypothetical protein
MAPHRPLQKTIPASTSPFSIFTFAVVHRKNFARLNGNRPT